MEIITLIFNNVLDLRTCDSIELSDVILKAKTFPREYKIPSRYTTRGPLLDACYSPKRGRHVKNFLNEAEVFGLSGLSDGATVKNNTMMKTTTDNGNNHPVAVCDIFDCTVNMEIYNKNDSKFIRNCMMSMRDDIYPRTELFNMNNFDSAKVVQVTGEILDVYHTNLTCILSIFKYTNTCFSYIGKK